jgi:RNA recognition motif-containing protein
MRGQAFVVFKDINSAMEAKATMIGKSLLGKPMKIDFAKSKSKLIA